MSLPQDTQGVGIVEGNLSFVTVQTDSEPWREGSSVGVMLAAVAAALGVQYCLAMALTLTLRGTIPFRKKDLTHANCEETEGRGILAIFSITVMATVWVTAERGNDRLSKNEKFQ